MKRGITLSSKKSAASWPSPYLPGCPRYGWLRNLGALCALCAFVFAGAVTAQAIDYTWQNTGDQVLTAANWSPTGVPGLNDRALFPLKNGTTVNPVVNGQWTVGAIRFDNSGTGKYTSLGGTGNTVTVGGTPINVGTGASQEQDDLMFEGTVATFTWEPNLVIAANTRLVKGKFTDLIVNGTVTLNAGPGTIPGGLGTRDCGHITFNNTISGTGGFIGPQGGIESTAGFTFNTANTFAGGFRLRNGQQSTTVNVADNDSLGTGEIRMNSGKLTIKALNSPKTLPNQLGGNISNQNNSLGTLIVDGDYNVTFSGTVMMRQTSLTVNVANAARLVTFNGPINIFAALSSNTLVKTGPGRLDINGTATVAAIATTVSAGTLGGIGSLPAGLTVNAGATLNPGKYAIDEDFGTTTLTMAADPDGGGTAIASTFNVATARVGSSPRSDKLSASSSVALQGALTDAPVLDADVLAPALAIGDVVTILINNSASPVSGFFQGLVEGQVFAQPFVDAGISDRQFRISYSGKKYLTATDSGVSIDTGNNDIVLSVVASDPCITATITCDGDQTLEAQKPEGRDVNPAAFTSVSVEGCSPTCVPAGLTFPIGTTPVTCSLANGANCSFNITIEDTTAPVLTCSNEVLEADEGGCSSSQPVVPTAEDAVDDSPTVVCTAAAPWPVGTTNVTCTATDAAGNSSSCTFTVTVNNPASCDDGNACTENDTCTGAVCGGTPKICDDSNVCTVNSCDSGIGCVYTPGNAGTECRASVGVCDVAEVCDGFNDECPEDGFVSAGTECRASAGVCDVAEQCTGSSAACPPDAKSTAVCRASVGECDVAEYCDGVGNVCPDDGFKAAGTPCGSSDSNQCDAADTCNGDGLCEANNEPNGTSCNDDSACSTTDTCQAGVCVGGPDADDPVITGVPAAASYQCVSAVPAAQDLAATDNCGSLVAVAQVDTNNGGSGCAANPLIITRTWKATDEANNTATATQTITVADTTVPSITAPADVTVVLGQVPAPDLNIASDNCGTVVVTSSDSSVSSCGDNAVITRTYTATDACGNTASDTQTITVVGLFQAGGAAITWHQPLARNGYSDDPNPSIDGYAYSFKAGSTIPVKIHANGCLGEVTANSNVIGDVAVYQDISCDGLPDGNELVIDYNGVGGDGGAMDLVIESSGHSHLQYNLSTKVWAVANKCYVIVATVEDTSTGESREEIVKIKAKK